MEVSEDVKAAIATPKINPLTPVNNIQGGSIVKKYYQDMKKFINFIF